MRNEDRNGSRAALRTMHVDTLAVSQGALHGSQGRGRVRHEHLVALVTQLQVHVGE